MIKIEHTKICGWESAIRGMRNPMNSWEKSDSFFMTEAQYSCFDMVGDNDLSLMKKLVKAGTDHSKFMRMINVYADVIAPLYWWKEYDTYKIGTVANSCSTMHKITERKLTIDDFSYEHLYDTALMELKRTIQVMNIWRNEYIRASEATKKNYWWQIIQLLPSSYNQKRTIMLNYQVLHNIYKARKDHKLDEWHDFCDWILLLPHFKEIIGE